MRYFRYGLWILVFLAIAVVVALGQNKSTSDKVGTVTYKSFEMTNHKGETVTEQDFIGKPTAFFFGFTYCPNICPMTLHHMTNMMKELGPDADRINIVFISVDPERDRVESLATYLTSFDSRIIGLVGTEEQVKQITKAFNIFYKKVILEDGDYTLDHTASTLLYNSKGEFRGTIDYQENPKTALEKLQMLAQKQ